MKLSRIVVKTRENGGNNANKLFPSPCNRVIKLVIRMNKTITRGGGRRRNARKKSLFTLLYMLRMFKLLKLIIVGVLIDYNLAEESYATCNTPFQHSWVVKAYGVSKSHLSNLHEKK